MANLLRQLHIALHTIRHSQIAIENTANGGHIFFSFLLQCTNEFVHSCSAEKSEITRQTALAHILFRIKKKLPHCYAFHGQCWTEKNTASNFSFHFQYQMNDVFPSQQEMVFAAGV